jgi:opacity protein-like surface antigen
MRRLAFSTLTVIAALAAPSPALAGTLPPLPSLDQPGNIDDANPNSTWYLRANVGVGLPGSPSMRPNFIAGATTASEDLRTGWAIGGAAGYQLGWLRTDLSLDYLSRRDFSESFSGACGAACTGRMTGKFSAMPILANLYYDIGTWNNFTPYASAGLGIAHVDWDKIGLRGQCSGPCPVARGSQSWRFAWQVGGGVSYGVSDTLSIDADYRLLDLGKGRVGATQVGNLAGKTLWDNEVRIGLRYKLN